MVKNYSKKKYNTRFTNSGFTKSSSLSRFSVLFESHLYFYFKIELKKLFMIFSPVKAEIPYFSELKLGGPQGDLGKQTFSLKLLIFRKF